MRSPKVSADGRLTVHGHNKDNRLSDAEFAAFTSPVEVVSLHRQPITRLPVFAGIRKLDLYDLPQLASLAGIERMVSLQELTLTGDRVFDVETYQRLADLPELVELSLHATSAGVVPSAIAKLPSLIGLTLYGERLDLDATFAAIANVRTLRSLQIDRCDGTLPDSLGMLVELEQLTLCWGKKSALPRSIGKLRKLKRLVLRELRLREVPDELFDCIALEVLAFEGTQLTKLSPKIAQLQNLTKLDLTSVRTLPKELGKLTKLRELRTAYNLKALPAEVGALRLDRYSGPFADQITFRPVETPQESDVVLTDPSRIPDDFGQPRTLELVFRQSTPPIVQLARCNQLRKLKVRVKNLSTVVPFIPPQLVELSLEDDGEIHALPALPALEVLSVGMKRANVLSFGAYPQLKTLFALGAITTRIEGLAQTQLSTLGLTFCRMPDPADLAGLPLTKLRLFDVQDLDVAALCDALAGKPLESLQLHRTKIRTLPKAIGKLAVKTLDLSHTGIAAVPDEVGQIRGLTLLHLPNIPFDKSVLPGRWKKTRRTTDIELTRSDL